MIKYLIDTNIISELSKHSPEQSVLDWASTVNRCALSVVTIEEIYFGLAWRPNLKVMNLIEKFIDEYCDIIPVTKSIARRAGILRGQLQAAGITRTQADIFIAATAAEHGLVVVTRNQKDFEGCGVALFDPFAGL